ncbi:MAG: GNAT family protein [Planctomycetota bacterium]
MAAHTPAPSTGQPVRSRAVPVPASPVRVSAESMANAEPWLAPLRSPRLRLRPLTAADRSTLLPRMPEIRRHLDPFLPLGAEEDSDAAVLDRQLELTAIGLAGGTAFRRAAFDRATGEFVGAFNLITIRRGLEFDADMSFWLAPGHTGRGLAVEGLTALLDHSFAALPAGLGLVAVAGWVQPDNDRCRCLIQRLGFRRSDEAGNYLSTGDRWHMHDRWLLTADRWAANRPVHRQAPRPASGLDLSPDR